MAIRGLFVGRFQPIHLGHCEAIKNVLREVGEVVVVVGSAQHSHELENPFTTGERISMIRIAMNEMEVDPSRYYLVPVPDVENHALWASLVMAYCPRFHRVYSNEALTRRLFKEAGYEVKGVSFYRRELYSATEVRRRMLNEGGWEELVPRGVAEFIRGMDGVERLKDLTKSDKAP